MPRTSPFMEYCPFPIYMDTYAGCTHSCVYCYANANSKGKRMAGADVKVEIADSYGEIENFILGKRTYKNGWADWDIPVCWGRNSDPFQPCERTEKKSLKILEMLAKYEYPVIITTKGTLLAEEPYLSVLKECKAVVQMSLVCDKMDSLEPNAPSFNERLDALKIISGVATRTIARMQPIFYEYRKEALRNIEKFKEAGAYGILVGMPRLKKPIGACNSKINFTYFTPSDKIISTYEALRTEAHKHGLVFNASDLDYINDN